MIFMNTGNSGTYESHIFRPILAGNLKNPNKNIALIAKSKKPNKNIALINLSIYYTWKNIKSAYNKNKFRVSVPAWNDEFYLPDRSHTISNV